MTWIKLKLQKKICINKSKEFLKRFMTSLACMLIYGQQLLLQKLSMFKELSMIKLKKQNKQNWIKSFWYLILVIWLGWLLGLVRLIKREPPSSIVYSSIRTEGGFSLRLTKCVTNKEELYQDVFPCRTRTYNKSRQETKK